MTAIVEVRGAINVGLAVDTERGLVVAVLRDALGRGIADLATEIKRLADGARSGSLTPAEMTGATVAVSNTGSYGSEAGTPILSPGTSITLAIGVIGPRALVVDGEVVARPACTLSCTFDHRVLDGATVGRALTDLVSLLENRQALGDLPRMKIVSLLPSATEIVYALGLGDSLIGVTDECDYPPDAVTKPVVSRSALPQGRPLGSREIDAAVRERMDAEQPLYVLDTDRLRREQPDVILTQDLCRVCAVPSRARRGSPGLARLSATRPRWSRWIRIRSRTSSPSSRPWGPSSAPKRAARNSPRPCANGSPR